MVLEAETGSGDEGKIGLKGALRAVTPSRVEGDAVWMCLAVCLLG